MKDLVPLLALAGLAAAAWFFWPKISEAINKRNTSLPKKEDMDVETRPMPGGSEAPAIPPTPSINNLTKADYLKPEFKQGTSSTLKPAAGTLGEFGAVNLIKKSTTPVVSNPAPPPPIFSAYTGSMFSLSPTAVVSAPAVVAPTVVRSSATPTPVNSTAIPAPTKTGLTKSGAKRF